MLPQLAEAFSKTTGQAASVVTVFTIAYGVVQLVYGPLGDYYGKYREQVLSGSQRAVF